MYTCTRNSSLILNHHRRYTTTPPVFHAISKAGVEEFKSTTKTLCRAGTKRRHRPTPRLSLPKRLKRDPDTDNHKPSKPSNELLGAVKRTVGRPKLKWSQRKRQPLPRQVSHETRKTVAAILRRGIVHQKCSM